MKYSIDHYCSQDDPPDGPTSGPDGSDPDKSKSSSGSGSSSGKKHRYS